MGAGYFVGRPGAAKRLVTNPASVAKWLVPAAEFLAVASSAASPTDMVQYAFLGVRNLGSWPVARVGTDSPLWHIIEFGSAKYAGVPSPPYAPVVNSVDEAGLRWVAM